MALKNSGSRTPNTLEKIQKVLAANGARQVMFDYAADQTMESISFSLFLGGKTIGFKLPALVDNVTEIMYGGKDRRGNKKEITPAQREQAYKTAWANIRDWIDAQMALVATRQVEVLQVFLPYMVMQGNQTLYEKVVSNPSFLLGNGE